MSSSAAAILSGDDNDKHHSPAHADPSVEDCSSEEEPEEDPEEEEEEEEEEGEEEEEEEVEEEEVEEEEEEEEELEDGKDDEEEEIGDGPSCSPHATDNIQQDVIPSVEFERHEKRLRSCSTQEKAEVGLPSDTFAVAESTGTIKSSSPSSEQLETPNGVSCTSDKVSKLPKLKENLKFFEDNGIQESCVGEKDAGSFPEKKTPRSHDEVHCDSNSHPLNSEIRHDETTKPSCCVGEVATLINKESNDVFHFEGGIEQSGLHSEDIKQRASSLDAPQIRPRSLSPCTEFVDGTKQSPVICDFFSKGWCIKGNSCKFLHTKGHVDNAGQQPERNVAAAKFKSELQIDEGLTDSTEKSRLSALRDPVASSAKIAGRDSLRQDPYPNNHSTSPIVERSFNAIGNNLLPEYGSFPSHSVITRGTKRSSWTPSSYAATMDEPSSKRSQSPFNDHTSPALSRYQKSGSNYSLPAIGIFPPDRVSAWTRSSMSYGSSSLNADSLNAQKVLNRNGELVGSRSASLLRSSSPFSASEPQIAHPSSGEHKRNFFSYDWEPSKPFRPSFVLSLPGMSSPGSQYDPIRDSIEQSNPVDGSFKVYPFGDPNLNGTLLPKYNANKYLITSHDKFQDNVLDKDCYAHDRNLSISEAEAAGSSVHDQQNETVVAKGENPLSSPHGMDVSETNKIKTGFDLRHQSDGSRHRKELKIHRGRHTDEMVVDQKTDAVLNQDSKAFRHFRAALVESVKESLKPAWREGRVSKDAHNLIVKKAVDKVLSTIQSHQIPSTVELIKQYLSSSQPKIVKLVEGYVDKYGKS